MDNPVINALVAWLLPGAGHFLQGKKVRGILIAVAVWLLVLIGLLSGGAYYPGFAIGDGFLLYILNVFAKLGDGLGYLLSVIFSIDPNPDAAARATFEYGGRYLEAAGLLNYLAIVDSADIRLGRKR